MRHHGCTWMRLSHGAFVERSCVVDSLRCHTSDPLTVEFVVYFFPSSIHFLFSALSEERLLSPVLHRQRHLEINNSSIAPLLSSSLAHSALSWPYGSVLSRARLLLRTLAPRKQWKGGGVLSFLSSPHIRLSLPLSVYSFPQPLSNFFPITFYSWKSRRFPIPLSLSFCFSWLFSDWPSGVWQFQWIASASTL